MDWAKTTARRDEKHFHFRIWCVLNNRFDGIPDLSGSLLGISNYMTCQLGPWFNIEIPSYQYNKSHCGDKTILRLSYLHNGIFYTGKMAALYWIVALLLLEVLLYFTIQVPVPCRDYECVTDPHQIVNHAHEGYGLEGNIWVRVGTGCIFLHTNVSFSRLVFINNTLSIKWN